MTATLATPAQIWNTMPGWGIVADLTPPELIASRRLKVLRKLLVAGLSMVVVLLLLGYGYARLQAHSAQSSLADENLRTSQLQAEQNRYVGVTEVQGSINATQMMVAGLMASDVDLNTLMGQLRGALPANMVLNTASVTISQAGATAAQAATGTLNTNGHQSIGKVQLDGNGTSLAGLAAYTAALQQIPGVVDVVPANNTVSGGLVSWSLNCSITDQVISHYFDKSKAASK